MITELRIIPLPQLDSHDLARVRSIYSESFPPAVRIGFDQLAEWMNTLTPDFLPVFWAAACGNDIIGLNTFAYLPRQNIGYLAYLAIRADRRGMGYGSWLCKQCLTALEGLAWTERNAPLRLVFWEVRRPDDAVSAADRVEHERRIRFYERLGGRTIPIDYTCPPVALDQPAVTYTVMARTCPPGGPIDRRDAEDIARAGLLYINRVQPESEYFRAALRSIEKYWPAGEPSRCPAGDC